MLGPAVTLASAARVASWSEGLLTVNQPLDRLGQMVKTCRGAGGTGPLALQVHLSWARTEAEAEEIAHEQRPGNVFAEPVAWELESAEAFETVSEHVTVQQVRTVVDISSDLD
jgi:hypothetical protein